MLTRAAFLTVAFLLGLITFLWAENSFSPAFQKCITNDIGQKGAERSEDWRLVIRDLVGPQAKCTIRLVDRHNGFFAALASSIIALFSFTLWWSAERLSKQSREQVRIADRSAKAAESAAAAASRSVEFAERALTHERPWIYVYAVEIRRRELRGQSPIPNNWYVALHLKNIGKAPAIIDKCLFDIRPKSELPPYPIYNEERQIACRATISPGGVEKTTEAGPSPGTNEIMVFYGVVIYKELHGAQCETGFAIEVSPDTPAYSPYPSNNYTYYK